MKTIVIWNQFENGIQYFVLSGDYSRFDQVFIGAVDCEALQAELASMLYNDDGEDAGKVEFLDKFPTELFYQNPSEKVIVIEAGYLP